MIGESIQNQDQVITLHSLRTIKAIVSNPKNPIPPWISILLVAIKFGLLFYNFYESHLSIYTNTIQLDISFH